jgi:hypothetical protein
MANISGLYFPDIEQNTVLQNVFNLETFMDNTNFSMVLSTNGVDYSPSRVWSLLGSITTTYMTKENTRVFVDEQFAEIIFRFILEKSFAPAWQRERSQHLFNAESPTQVNAMGANIKAILNSNVDYSYLETIESQLTHLNDELFRFGRAFAGYGNTFDVGAFKVEFVNRLVNHFYPYLYFIHILKAQSFCKEFKCKRVYNLAKYVFVYYLCASMFLLIYSTTSRVDTYMKDQSLSLTTQAMESRKEQLIRLQDGLLKVLAEENSFDDKTSVDQNAKSTIAGYYDKISMLSNLNMAGTNYINEKKKNATIMQNNLGNYSNIEARNFIEMKRAKTIFWVLFAIICAIISLLILFIFQNKFTYLYTLSGVTLLALAMYGLISVIRSNRS